MPPRKNSDEALRESLKANLRNVYWVGGGSGAGKSTIARRLAKRYGLKLYATDEKIREHGFRTPPAERPFSCAFAEMDMDERWVNRSPEEMLDTFHFFRGECFERIVEDLQEATEAPIIAEGFRLLPYLVKPLLSEVNQGVWLLPTPEFRRAAFESRGELRTIAGRTSNPERALQNLLARDALFTAHLREEIGRIGLLSIEVDESMSEDALVDRVAGQFCLG